MSKKNNRGKDQRYIKFLLDQEKKTAEKKVALKKRKDNAKIRAMEAQMTEKRKAVSRKPKVPPVMGSKVKLEKMLKKSMKALSIGSSAATKSRKIDLAGSDDDSDSDDQQMEGEMDAGQAAALQVPKSHANKVIFKKERQSITKAQEIYLKKEIKRRLKMGSKKDAKKLKRTL